MVLPGSDTVHAQSSANGLFPARGDTLFVVGYRTGLLSLTGGHGFWEGSPDGIDGAGRESFYVSDNVGGELFLPADLVVDRKRGWLVVPENAGNRLSVYKLTKLNSRDT